MGPVLINQMVHVDKQRPQILDLPPVMFGVDGERADQFEEVEEQRFGELAEVEGVVERPFGGRG